MIVNKILKGKRVLNFVSKRNFCTKFSKTHEWVKLENNIATLGISKYAADSLKEINNLDLPELNSNFKKNEIISTIESTKAVANLYTNLSGKCILINQDVILKPSLINESPEDKGWILKLEINDKEEFNKLMTKSEYENFIQKKK